jgi:hypothetical protein
MILYLNAFQITALEIYSNGEFSYLASVPIGGFETSLARCGDTLLHFILCELSTTEGCHTRSDAILRLASAAEEIDTIVATLHNAQHETSSPPNDGKKSRQGES